MYPSIFFSNNYQRDFEDYLIVKEFNLNNLYENSLASTLTLQLPTTSFESELLVPSPYTYTQEDTYFEDNLSAAREDSFYRGINKIDQKYFYRILDNDLATLNARGLYEYTLPASYILITYSVNNILHELYLPLPLKELIYNYYVDGQLSLCPLNISFGYEANLISHEILKPDDTLVTEFIPIDYYTAAVNSLFTELIIDGLPSLPINIKLFINNALQTSTTTTNSLVFYPKIKFSESIISLDELAISLYSIQDFRPLDYDVLLNSLLNGLTHQIQEKEYYLPISNLFSPKGAELVSLTTDCTLGLDVVFILDYSGLMSTKITELKNTIDTYINKLSELTLGNYRTALVSNDTVASNPTYRVATTFNIRNKTELLAGYNSLGALKGGATAPEPFDFIIEGVITGSINLGGWRDGVNKLIVLISNGTGEESDLLSTRNAELPLLAYNSNIRIVGLQVETTHSTLVEYFSAFTQATYGQFLYSTTEDISESLINIFDNLCEFNTDSSNYVYLDNFDRYSYYDNTLLILSLLFNISHTYSINLQKYLEGVIDKLISSFNLFSGYCNKEISINLAPIIINDIPTTIILTLVLEKYLSFKYNSLYEYILYYAHKQLDSLIIDQDTLTVYLEELGTVDEQIDLLFHVTLWIESRDQVVYILSPQDYTNFRLLITNLIEETDPNLISIESVLKINYLINLLNLTLEPATLSNWDYSNFITEYYSQVWGDDEPSLFYSSWVNIIEKQIPLWVSSSYRIKTIQSETFLANIFQRSLKYIPINEPWFNPDNLDPNIGLIGLIMKAVSNLYLPLIFEYLCLSSSLNIDNAYGFGLDKWGLFLDYPRELNEDDDSYRHKLKQFLTINFINSTNLETFIDNIKQVSATTLESELPTTILYENQSYTVLDVQDFYLKARENNPPSVTLTTGEQFELAKELGVVKITSYETEEYNKVFLKLKELFGVPVILKTIQSFELLDSNTIIYPN